MSTSLRVAQFIDGEIPESADELAKEKVAKVYAVIERQGVLTKKLVDSDPDPYKLLVRVPKGVNMDDVTSLCLVMTGWMSKIDESEDDSDEDDDGYVEPERERVRVTAAVSDEGVSVVVRKYNEAGESVDSFADGGEGVFPEALRTWWDVCKKIMAVKP